MSVRLRTPLRLLAPSACVESCAFPDDINHHHACHKGTRTVVPVTIAVHRFQELIAGRPYQIEVAPVSKDRWRAYIVRIPGVPTALMPFYGTTPNEAADLLRRWLTRAHERAAAEPRRV